jgi:hypothetical protein
MHVFRHIIAFWAETWRVSKTLFFAEMFGTLFGMGAALILSMQAPNPNLLAVFLCYNISCVSLIYSNYKRHSSWMVILMTFYLVTNIIGISKLL